MRTSCCRTCWTEESPTRKDLTRSSSTWDLVTEEAIYRANCQAVSSRALFSKPELLLADEPTGNLDRKNSAEIVELLKESNRKFGQTLILITHDENIALQADRIIYMEDGNITKDDRIRVTDLMGRE